MGDTGSSANTGGAAPAAFPGGTSGNTQAPNFPLGFGGQGSSIGSTLFGLPAAGSVSPQEQAWTDFTKGQNLVGNAFAFGPGTGSSTMHTMADVGSEAGDVLQTMRIDDAMKSAAQQFANAQKGALGAELGGLGSALGGIFKIAGI